MEKMLKDDIAFDKLKFKNTVKNEMKGEERLLKREIEIDKGMGRNTARKEERLSELNERIKSMDNNELEKITDTNNENNQISKNDSENSVEDKTDKKIADILNPDVRSN